MSAPAPPEFPSAEELGNQLLQYEVRERLEVGRESAIYHAYQTALDRQVMIRVLAEPPAEAASRLMERLRARARLVHPRIIAVYDFGRSHGGHLYLVTEHVDGRLLAELIRERQITPKLAYTLALQLCETLAMIHDNQTVHGALNTRTLLVDREWQLKVTGIGMAENADGEISWLHEAHASEQDDLFGLGCVLHEMFGKEPLGADGRVSRNLPPTFAAVIRRCVHADPSRRYHTASEVREALVNALRSEKQSAAAPAAAAPAMPAPAAPARVASEPAAAPAGIPQVPRYAPGRPPPPVQRAQPSFGKRLDDFLWSCLRAGLHLTVFFVTASILFVSYILKDKIVIKSADDAASSREEPAITADVLGKLPEAPQLPQAPIAAAATPITLPMAPAPQPAPPPDPLAELREQYRAAVQAETAAALDKVRLDDLPFYQRELQRLQSNEPVPEVDEPALPAALKRLRDIYRQQSARLTK